LFHEALAGRDLARELVRHHLQHDREVLRKHVGRVHGPADVDVAHPAFADLPLDAVVADHVADHFSSPSSSQWKPSWHNGMNRKRCEPMRMMSLPLRSRRGSISLSFTYVPFVELWSMRMNRRSSGRNTRSAWCDDA